MSFLNNLEWRYATKKFDATKKVSQENLDTILKAVQFAPSSYGVQSYKVLVVTNQELREKLKAVGYNQPQITDASHLLVFCSRTDLDARVEEYITTATGGDATKAEGLAMWKQMVSGAINGMPAEMRKPWTDRQTYIALGFGLAAAAELEIDSCPMEGFDAAQFKAILGLPEFINPVVLLPIGYRAADDLQRPKVRYNDLFETLA